MSYWAKHKSRIKSMKGVRREHLVSYLAEFMWRDRYQASAFRSMMTHISSQFRWCNVYFVLFHIRCKFTSFVPHASAANSRPHFTIICCLVTLLMWNCQSFWWSLKFYYCVRSFMVTVRFTCFLWNKMLWFFFVISVNMRTLTLRKTETFFFHGIRN